MTKGRKTTIQLIVLSDDELFDVKDASLERIGYETDEGSALLHSMSVVDSTAVDQEELERLSVEAGSDADFFWRGDEEQVQ